MNIVNFGAEVRTMTSREIAEITGKRHDNVMADIRKMLADLGLTSADFSADLPDSSFAMSRLMAYSLEERP